jgi:hypothetical protein
MTEYDPNMIPIEFAMEYAAKNDPVKQRNIQDLIDEWKRRGQYEKTYSRE